ncbi:hypothetical protein ACUY4R_002260 [Kosakonia sp. BK9b]|uniref:hypothetical protein n=1 Tax=Kosakonia sp. TaxID=1916651 RepID=UPI002899F105|nr:hypothetical protein [Kosakonia sp.]
MKRITLGLILAVVMNSALAGGDVHGTIALRLVILPANGCLEDVCVVDPGKAFAAMQQGKQADAFITTRQGHLLTIAF